MSNTSAIKQHMMSVRETKKITGAMYLISATKLQRAKAELHGTRPFFEEVKKEIKRIFRTVDEVDSHYFFPPSGEEDFEGAYGYLVITADKGLAGAYNKNVIRETLRMLQQHNDNRLYVVGEYGRQYFDMHGYSPVRDFSYTAQSPTIERARNIAETLINAYNREELRKIFVIYTDAVSGQTCEAITTRLLPFHPSAFASPKEEEAVEIPFEFVPSVRDVLDHIIPSYITGFVYSALVASFCSEENARMLAMDNANHSAEALLETLQLKYNHVRQSEITREIIEISSGSRSLRNARGNSKELIHP